MLVLTRKVEEAIVIDERITVTVVAICGGKVRLGIQAPREVPVNRSEIQTLINKERDNAGQDE